MLSKPEIKPTEEGEAIIKHVKESNDNILVEAFAGCGKTTMLEFTVGALPKDEPVLYLVFGKQDQLDAESRLPSRCVTRTMNGMGHRICGSTFGKVALDPGKVRNILKQKLSELTKDDYKDASEEYWEILGAVGMARHIGYIPDGKFPDAWRLCDRDTLAARIENKISDLGWYLVDNVLFTSIKAAYAGTIDFDDQVYMPALFGGTFPRFPNVLVDESQDLSPVNHALLQRLVKGRFGAVGDRWQSIYYFRGAETGGVDKLKTKYTMKEFPLSVSFRCPSAIVNAARWRVPNLKWNREGGHYEVLKKLLSDDIPDGAAIVCRNNAPLFRAAFSLLSNKRSVQVAGSDIGPKIVMLLRKIGSPKDSQEDILFKIDAWRDEKLERTNSPQTIIDTAECLKVFATWGKDVEQAVNYAEYIFKQRSGKITLTTGHKAKGKEWDVVYHMDPQLLRDDDQDLNLRYVITTRAKERLYEVRSEEIQW